MSKMYDFDEIIDRHHTNSYKWDSSDKEDMLPMWVADMDFRTAPPIIEALRKRVEHGIFGYTRVPDSYYQAIIQWFGQQHDWKIDADWILYTSGVVPAISAIIKALTSPNDKVIIMTPVYNCFFSSIRNNDCEILDSPLKCIDNRYYMDYEDLEEKARDPKAKLLLLCNPHNPVGRVWTAEELKRMNDICLRNNIIVVSDEIHCELVFPQYHFTSFASIDAECQNNSIVCTSPSKAFNIAGLQIANIISNNPEYRVKIDRALNINEVCDVNPFGVIALEAAYKYGKDWLKELNQYIYENYLTLVDFFERNLPEFPVNRMEGTYLVWVDCRVFHLDSERLEHELMDSVNLWLNAGTMYGLDGFMRINIACPKSVMLEGLNRFAEYAHRALHII